MDSSTRRVRPSVHKISAALLFATTVVIATSASAETMPLSAIQKGMKGYGVTVFQGNKLEKFDVEILGVLRNIGPGQNLILARIASAVTDRAGVIAGMSGSPIYIDGKVIGALAYSWQFAKEPVAGITPIDEMLKISRNMSSAPAMAAAAPRMSGAEFLNAIANHTTDASFEKFTASLSAATAAHAMSTRPIAVPLSMSSFAPETISRFSKVLDGMGFVAVPSGTASTSATNTVATNTQFQPGDAVGAVLVNGDFNIAATGTVTHIEGDRIFAFGHPFLDMGAVSFPMAKADIVTVMPSLASSFKLSNSGAIVGSFRQDRATGIMGVMGEKADMIPIDVSVEGSGPAQKYRVNIVRHSVLSPLILAMAADSVVANAQRAAGERTVLLDSEIKLKGFATPIRLREGWAGARARQAIPQYLAIVAGYVMSNEFRDAEIESVKLHLRHDDLLKIAKLAEASIERPPNGRITPGDIVKVRTVLKPYRGKTFVETFEVRIPDDQAPGSAYLLVGSGSVVNQVDFTLVPPDPRTLEQVIATLERLRPSTDLTVGFYSSGEGSVTAGVYLPNLPPTIRAVVTGDTSNSAQAPVRYHASNHVARPLGYIIDGAVKIDIDVKPHI